ncbi:Putative anti-sigma factor [hydrothermal vent metagenome]|uniref:Anti-sigma factor n=1 Tax=hydrothermal vent metagenome TaxID=652676 RepID=A0A3B0SXN2_9ZZZZ
MNSNKIENLIVKYLTNEETAIDLDFLSKWIENPDNERFFYDYVKVHYEVSTAMNGPDIDSIKKNLQKRIKKDKKPFYRYKVNIILKYAALVTVVLGISYVYQKHGLDSTNSNKVVKEDILVPKDDAITIQLDDSTVKIIDPEGEAEIRDSKGNLLGSQSKSQITYSNVPTVDKLIYNTINVPYGKRFRVVLSDGTHIHLNSGTSIRYPVKFINGKDRDVFITGEAYFDVAKDKDHPFIVHADKMNIRVLGTKFNVSHYSENKSINTVLVEGSVELYVDEGENVNTNNSTLLKPGHKAQWGKSNRSVEIENVDTRIYTAWVEGKLIFRNTSFRQIRKTLERQYNVRIRNSNKDLDAQLFDATFDIETINEILKTFNKSYAIEYSIVDNEVLIK